MVRVWNIVWEPMAHCTIADIRSRVFDGKIVILLVNMMREEKEEQFARISAAGVIAALAEIGQWAVFKMHSKLIRIATDNFRTEVLSTNIVNDFPKLLQDQGQACKSIIDTLMALAEFGELLLLVGWFDQHQPCSRWRSDKVVGSGGYLWFVSSLFPDDNRPAKVISGSRHHVNNDP